VRCRTCRSEYFRPDVAVTASPSERSSAYWERYKFGLYSSDDVRRDYELRYARVFELAERRLGPIRSVIDVGTGIGNFLVWASGTGRTAVGIDSDPSAVTAARERGLRTYELADFEKHVPDASFDAGSMWDVIEHIYDPDPAVEQLIRKVRPGGAIVLETPNVRFPLRRLLLSAHACSRGYVNLTSLMYYWEHKIYFSEEGLRRLLARHRCDVVVIEKMTSPTAKMRRMYGQFATEGEGRGYRLLSGVFPLLEWVTHRARSGNKIVLVARRHPD